MYITVVRLNEWHTDDHSLYRVDGIRDQGKQKIIEIESTGLKGMKI